MNPNKALWEKGDFTRIAESMRESATCSNLTVSPIDNMIATSEATFSSLIRLAVSISFSADGHCRQIQGSASKKRDGKRRQPLT